MSWYYKILVYDGIQGQLVVDTKKLRAYIEEHGIDLRNRYKYNIFGPVCFMTKEQIDVIFEYKPSPYIDVYNGILYSGFVEMTNHGVYVLQKLLEQDTDFLYMKKKICLSDCIYVEQLLIPISDLRKISKKRCKFDEEQMKKAMELIENHAKRYHTFFDLMRVKLIK